MRSSYRIRYLVPFLATFACGVATYFAAVWMFTPNQAAYQEAMSQVGNFSSSSGRIVQKRQEVQKEFWHYKGCVYHDHPQTLNFDSQETKQIEALRSERRSPSPSEKGEEEDQFGKVVASQNSKFEGDRGIRLPIKLTARESQLYIDETKGVSEQFEGVVCSIEEPDGISVLKADWVRYEGDEMTLEGGVVLQNDSGTVRCHKALIRWNLQSIKEIEAQGKVVMQHAEGWRIDSDRALLEPRAQKAFFFADPGRQVIFQDEQGRMRAARAEVELSSHLCTLEEGVKLVHREGPLRQCALADRVILSQEKGELHFFADLGKRVLFFDAANHLEMSAPELIAARDPVTNKEKVQGRGDVRFRLSEQEFQRLKNSVK